MRRCGATSACSATCSGGCSSSRRSESLLADVERVRALARAARAGAPHDELAAAVGALPLERQASVLRAFALYFQLANVAEQQHRVRRLRAYELEERVPRRVARRLVRPARRRAADGARAAVSLELVLTAHPTEATRRTVLASHLRIARAARASSTIRCSRPPPRARSRRRSRREITAHWQTDEVRSRRPRVVDEIRNGHWFFEQSLIDAAERLLADYRRRLPGAPPPLRFGTWIGGDADGNPNAGAETIAEALERARTAAAAPLPRRGARARGRRSASRRASTPVDDGAARVDRSATSASLPSTPRRSATRTSTSRTGASSRSCGGGSTPTRTRRPTTSPADLARARPQPAREPRRAHRRRRARGAAAPRRDLRPAPRASSTCACTRATSSIRTSASAASSTRSRRPAAARRAGARHRDRLGHDVGRRRAPRARADGRAAVGRAALRVGRRAPRGAAHLRGAARHGRLPRGDGRLLRLGEGRGLPRARSGRSAARSSRSPTSRAGAAPS